MVLYKRKPISYVEPPSSVGPDTEVWVMRGSDEIFTSYEAYLKRYDFYSRRNFTDAVNGKTGMTFHEALESENTSSNDIERIFPEALRAPILRRVQFSEINRMDDLVSHVYEEFRNDFFPGEELSAVLDDGEAIECIVREKANFPELRNPDGSVQRPAFARYFVRLKTSNEEALLDSAPMKRGRNVFTKQNVRTFLKNCLQRESWNGAPWLVREQLAQQYRLPMMIPRHLTQEAKLAQQRFLQAQKEAPTTKTKKMKPSGPPPFSVDQLREPHPSTAEEKAKSDPTKVIPDDLDLRPNPSGGKRPRLNLQAPLLGEAAAETGLVMSSIGLLLELWNALNVHCDVFELDSFTYDDFSDAMRFSSTNVACELFEEVHCGVLKTLVDKAGEVQITLLDVDSDADEQTTEEDSVPHTPIEPAPRSSRSRLSQVQHVDDHHSQNGSSHKLHAAAEMLEGRGWIERLQARDFADGGWQIIVIGLLHQLSLDDLWSKRAISVLKHLAPVDMAPSSRTAKAQYDSLDVNQRIIALQIIVTVAMSSQTFRKSLDDRNDAMTVIRKQKTEVQRDRKERLKELARLELDRAENNPDAFVDDETKTDEIDTPHLLNGHHDDTLSINGMHSTDEDEEDVPRHLRRSLNARKRKRDEENMKKETARVALLSAQKETAEQLKKYKGILKNIEKTKDKILQCERTIEQFDEQLREMNTARMRPLGRDRYCNRYWWFERVGLPLDGIRERSRKKVKLEDPDRARYANARVWVQGPSSLERQGFLDMTPEDEKLYVARHGMTVAERKLGDEGAESLQSADQWGSYDTADDLDALIGWLDDRGRREKDLRRELTGWRDEIVRQMGVLQDHLHPAISEDGDASAEEAPRTRVSTRNKTYLDTHDVEKRFPCLRWHNTHAATKSGRHLQPAKPEPESRSHGRKSGGGSNSHAKKPAPAAPAENGTAADRAQSSRSGASGKGVAQPVARERGAARQASARIASVVRDEIENSRYDSAGAGAEAREGMGTRRSTRSTR